MIGSTIDRYPISFESYDVEDVVEETGNVIVGHVGYKWGDDWYDEYWIDDRNPRKEQGEAPHICQIWASTTEHAWNNEASWVIFLGDDIRVECPFHYRAMYRYFLDNQVKFDLSQDKYFGCPWFNDDGFKGFPTFPIVGKEHFRIFGGLIPDERKYMLINQDLARSLPPKDLSEVWSRPRAP